MWPMRAVNRRFLSLGLGLSLLTALGACTGTPTPFNSLSSIGLQHTIQYGAQSIDFTTLLSDVLVVPSSSTSSVVYAIGHSSTSTTDSYHTFTNFITALQSDLNGTTLATAMTVEGIYTSASYPLTAASVTVYLNI
jgi:hypothetical protein